MILHKFWSAMMAQINKVANLFWEADPVAQMRYEYDQAVAQLKEGRVGLGQVPRCAGPLQLERRLDDRTATEDGHGPLQLVGAPGKRHRVARCHRISNIRELRR